MFKKISSLPKKRLSREEMALESQKQRLLTAIIDCEPHSVHTDGKNPDNLTFYGYRNLTFTEGIELLDNQYKGSVGIHYAKLESETSSYGRVTCMVFANSVHCSEHQKGSASFKLTSAHARPTIKVYPIRANLEGLTPKEVRAEEQNKLLRIGYASPNYD